jgi:hypothetical protein
VSAKVLAAEEAVARVADKDAGRAWITEAEEAPS